MIPPISMLQIQELPWAPTVVLLLDPAARVRPPLRVCPPPANAPSGSGPDNMYTSKQKWPYFVLGLLNAESLGLFSSLGMDHLKFT